MNFQAANPPSPEPLFTSTGSEFFNELSNFFQDLCDSRQVLVVKRAGAGDTPLELVFASGFPVALDLPACLERGLSALCEIREPCWVWPSAAADRSPEDSLLAATAAESFLGASLRDEQGGHFGYLLLYGPPCRLSSSQFQQLQYAGWRTAGEVLRLQHETSLLNRARLHQTVLNAIPVPIFFKDTDGRYLGCNDAFTRFLNKPREEIVGQEVYGVAPPDLADVYRQADLELLAQGGAQVYESSVRIGSGERRQVIFHKAVFYDHAGNKGGISGTVVDVTQLRAAEDEARYLTHFDTVTGLPNQTLLRDRLEQELLHAQYGGYELAVLCLDLDGFKKLNNVYGHPFGDRVLADVAQRMREVLDDEDTVARLGGDSFIVLAQLRPGRRTVREIALQLLETIRRPLLLDGKRVFLSASLGIALYPHDGRDACSLLSQADAAQARAKETEQGTFMFFTPALNTIATEQLLLEEHLRHAIDENQFFLLYQPQVDAVSGRIIGAEALLRWQHPDWGLVRPERFIPLAEQTRLIRPLGETVLEMACSQAKSWMDAGIENLRVTVNISPMQFQDQELFKRVSEILNRTGLDPRRLGLEITETEVMRDFDHAINCLARFRELGLHLAIDDFGTGYSSLSYLKHFPIDLLKIDRSFISGLPQCQDDAAIVTAIIALGRSLGLNVLAEGVETAAQESFLTTLGCVAFQGYYYGRPLTAEAFGRLLSDPQAVHG